jgi:hypothetical protein
MPNITPLPVSTLPLKSSRNDQEEDDDDSRPSNGISGTILQQEIDDQIQLVEQRNEDDRLEVEEQVRIFQNYQAQHSSNPVKVRVLQQLVDGEHFPNKSVLHPFFI